MPVFCSGALSTTFPPRFFRNSYRMGLLSIFRRRVDVSSPGAAASEPAGAVQQARTRARHRLIGAIVLVGIGVIGFPLVFETQPRPIPVDIPIDIPRKEGAAPLVMPQSRAPGPSAGAERPGAPTSSLPGVVPGSGAAARDDVITESREEVGHEVVGASQPVAAQPLRVPAAPMTEPLPASAAPIAVAPVSQKPVEPKPRANLDDGTRAMALLEGKEPSSAGVPRYVVQVGAFADPKAAQEARAKAEKLGLKTYTQVAETAAGSRIRVRVGPFATRDEANKAQARARSGGLAAAVLAL
jgi:DedD protein